MSFFVRMPFMLYANKNKLYCMGTYTEKFNLYKPAVGETGWGTLVSNNFEIIDNLTAEDWGAQPTLTFDTTPTSGSSNPVTSNGIKVAIDAKQNIISGTSGNVVTYTTTAGTMGGMEVESSPSTSTNKLVTSAGVKTAVDSKQAKLSGTNGNVVTYTSTAGTTGGIAVSDTVSSTGTGLVTSRGISTAVNAKQAKLSGTNGSVVTYTSTAGTTGEIAVSSTVSSTNNGLVTSAGIFSAVDAKQAKIGSGMTTGNVLTYNGSLGNIGQLGFDSAVTQSSTKLVKSGAIYTAIKSEPTILKGTTEPSSGIGKDGDIYIYYTT